MDASSEYLVRLQFQIKIQFLSKNSPKRPHFSWISSLLGRGNFIGFYFDWAIDATSSLSNYVVVSSSGSSYIGMFLYINGMMRDMKMRLNSMNNNSMEAQQKPSSSVEKWSIYVREMDFHVEIIGYLPASSISQAK